jgi:septum formation protein
VSRVTASSPLAVRLVLASRSPRRLELLRLAGLDPQVRPPDVDETPLPGERPLEAVVRLASTKARAARRGQGEVVLAADTGVIVDGKLLGKPRDPEHAKAMLAALAGRAHEVATGVVVRDTHGRLGSRVVTTSVLFAPLGAATISAYVDSGEPLGKAGAYEIQGRGAVLVERIEGSWTNVVGLPVVETLHMLAGAGVTPA